MECAPRATHRGTSRFSSVDPVQDNDQAGQLRAVRWIVFNHDEPAVRSHIVRSARCRTRINKVLRLKKDARFAELQSRTGRVKRDAGQSSLTIEKEQLGSIG